MLDLKQLESYLRTHVNNFSGPITIKAFPNGQSNPTFLLTTPSKKYVLRKKPEGELLKSAHAVEREFCVQNALLGTDVPVARVLHLCLDINVLGTEFYVMEFADGRIFWDPALPDLSSCDRPKVYAEMARVLAAIHSVDLNATGLQNFGKTGSYFARQLRRWSSQYEASRNKLSSEMDELIDWLKENLPEDDGQVVLVHGDYRIDNLMFEADSFRVKAVFDWELSTLGHPLADLAYQAMQRAMGRDWQIKGLRGLDLEALGIPSEENYVAAYSSYRNLQGRAHWKFAKAFAFFRFSVICHGVEQREREGNAASPDARCVGKMGPLLARIGYNLIKQK